MTTTSTQQALPASTGQSAARRLTFGHVLRSEWIKLTGLRSTWMTLGSILVLLVAFAAISAAVSTGSVDAGNRGPSNAGTDPVATVLGGAMFGVLILGVLGALAGSREYSSGMIRSTFAAVPRRLPVLWAKSLVFVGLALPVAVAGVLGAFFLGTAILSNADAATVSWSDEGVIRAVLGQACFIVGIGLIGLFLGILVRGVAGSIGLLVGGVLILPQFATLLLPDSWETVLKYLPSNAASSFTNLTADPTLLGAVPGALVFACWVALALGAAAVSITRRDA